jgi:glucose-1-phosphate thymidylyltransferase
VNGVILAGGYGSRLSPLTTVVNKHLLPVYNKPMIYYSLSTLLLAGAKKILVVTNHEHLEAFKKLLGDGSGLGVELIYDVQERPRGLPDGLSIAIKHFGPSPLIMILGDNIFHGVGLGKHLGRFANQIGCTAFGFQVSDPDQYGVANLDHNGKIISLEEKPKLPKSNIAITGLYFFDESAIRFLDELRPSARGELEIVDLLNSYLKQKTLRLEMLPRGTAWFDTGTVEGLHEASTYIKVVERRTGLSIGDPTESSGNKGISQ